MIYIFDNITDKIDFATIILYALESPSDHKFILTGKDKIFYDELVKNPKIIGYLVTYFPDLTSKYNGLINSKLYFIKDYNTCINNLKKEKYIIYGTTPHLSESKNIFDIKIKEKSAFVFGSENGLSKEKKMLLDKLVHYPLEHAKFLKIRHIFPVVHGINLTKTKKYRRLK